MKTPHTIKLYDSNGNPQYDPITDTHSDVYTSVIETPCLANYISQQRSFEMYGDRTNRVMIVRFSQEQQPFDKAEFDGRTFVPIEAIDAPIKGAVRLKEVQDG